MFRQAATVAACCCLLLSNATPAVAQGDARVLRAAEARDWATLRSLVKQRANVNAAAADGATALHWAAYWDDVSTVDLLVISGAKADVPNALGVTPLALAAANGNADVVKRLLKAGANPNAASAVGETPLMRAARTGAADAVRALLAAGANVNATEADQAQTALIWAAAEGHATTVRALIEAGAAINAADRLGFTPLMFAARSGTPDAAGVLLDAGADIDATAHDFLADTSEVPWLLGAGDYELLHASAATPLHLSIMSGNWDVAAFLIQRGADVNAAAPGYTPLHAAVLHGQVDLVKPLVARGAQLEAVVTRAPRRRLLGTDIAFTPGYVGTTPLFLAAKFAEPEIVRLLAEAGADPRFATSQGAAGGAFLEGAQAQTTVLLAAAGDSWGSGQDRRGRNLTGLAYQDDGRSLQTVRAICEYAAKRGPISEYVNAANASGETALHAAAARGLNDVVRFLVEQGADIHAKDKRQRTPLMRAEAGEDLEKTVELLRSLGARE